MAYRLEQCAWIDGWYVLEGGSNWACVEGTAEEWLAIAEAIRKRERVNFKRCAVKVVGDSFAFHSPRNACSSSDIVDLTAAEADALAANIIEVLRESGAATG